MSNTADDSMLTVPGECSATADKRLELEGTNKMA